MTARISVPFTNHRANVHSGNVLLGKLPAYIDHFSIEDFCTEYYSPETVPITRVDKTPLTPNAP